LRKYPNPERGSVGAGSGVEGGGCGVSCSMHQLALLNEDGLPTLTEKDKKSCNLCAAYAKFVLVKMFACGAF